MFTGIIQEVGLVSGVARSSGLLRLTIHAPKIAATTTRCASVAVNGVCLSVVSRRRTLLAFDVIPETRQRTTLGQLCRGDRVNLEPSLSVSDRLSGHFVFGHVDGVGTITRRRQRAGELILTITVPPHLRTRLMPKGSVAVDGVSLTVGPALGPSTFTIHLIPETVRQTTLGRRALKSRVNVELDYVAKLVWQFVKGR